MRHGAEPSPPSAESDPIQKYSSPRHLQANIFVRRTSVRPSYKLFLHSRKHTSLKISRGLHVVRHCMLGCARGLRPRVQLKPYNALLGKAGRLHNSTCNSGYRSQPGKGGFPRKTASDSGTLLSRNLPTAACACACQAEARPALIVSRCRKCFTSGR